MNVMNASFRLFFVAVFITTVFNTYAQSIKSWKSLYESAETYYLQEEYDSSLLLIDSFLLSDLKKEGFLLCKGYLLKAEILIEHEKYNEVFEFTKRATIEAFDLEGEMATMIESISNLVNGKTYYYQGRNRLAEDKLKYSLDKLEQNDESRYLLSCLGFLAIIGFDEGDDVMAYKYSKYGSEIAKENKNLKYLPHFLNMMGDAQFKLEYYQKAIKDKSQALELFQKQENHYEIAASLFDLGLYYNTIGEEVIGDNYYQMGLDSSKKYNFENLTFKTYNNLALKKKKLGDFHIAITLIDTALYYARRINYKDDILSLLSSKAAMLGSNNDLQGALNTLKVDFEVNDLIARSSRVEYFQVMGELLTRKGEWREANNYFQASSNLLQQEISVVKKRSLEDKQSFIRDDIANWSKRKPSITVPTENPMPNWIVALLSCILTGIVVWGFIKWRDSNSEVVDEDKENEDSQNMDATEEVDLTQQGKLPLLLAQQEERIKLNDEEVYLAKQIIHIDRDETILRVFIEGEKRHVQVWKTLNHFEKILPFPLFFRVHKSHIVNIKHLKTGIISKEGELELSNGHKVVVAARKRKKVKDHLEKYLFNT